jgi:hypothetical protein
MVRKADGKMHVLKLGEQVEKGDIILTTQDGIVQLTPELEHMHLAVCLPDHRHAPPEAGHGAIDGLDKSGHGKTSAKYCSE